VFSYDYASISNNAEEYRAECDQGIFASLLLLNGPIIYAIAVAAV